MHTKVVSLFVFLQDLPNNKKINNLQPKMTEIVSRGPALSPAVVFETFKVLSMSHPESFSHLILLWDAFTSGASNFNVPWKPACIIIHLFTFNTRVNRPAASGSNEKRSAWTCQRSGLGSKSLGHIRCTKTAVIDCNVGVARCHVRGVQLALRFKRVPTMKEESQRFSAKPTSSVFVSTRSNVHVQFH